MRDGEGGLADVLNDVLNHGLAGDRGERLAGKSGGGVARGDYYQDRWGRRNLALGLAYLSLAPTS